MALSFWESKQLDKILAGQEARLTKLEDKSMTMADDLQKVVDALKATKASVANIKTDVDGLTEKIADLEAGSGNIDPSTLAKIQEILVDAQALQDSTAAIDVSVPPSSPPDSGNP